MARVLLCTCLVVALSACQNTQARQYQLQGQLLAIGQTLPDGSRQATVKHGDIQGFMPGMTMPYYVRPAAALDGLVPGDTVSATLVVNGGEAHLERLRKTGHAVLPPDAHAVRILDVMAPGDRIPDAPLVDQSGATRRLTDWVGQALAVTFVYTRCPVPDFCPLMDRHFADLARAIDGDPSLRGHVHLASISFDPAHDTPDVIAAHAREHGADGRTWSYLTGTPEAIDALTSRFGVSTTTDSGPLITHNLRTAIVDAHGRLVTIHTGNDWTVADVLAELRTARGR